MRTCTPFVHLLQHRGVRRVRHRRARSPCRAPSARGAARRRARAAARRGARTGRSAPRTPAPTGRTPPCIRSACTRSIITASRRGQLGVQLGAHPTGPLRHPDGQQRRRRDQHDLGAQGREQEHVRARDPAVQDVADDPDPLARRWRRAGRAACAASSSAWVGCSWVPSPALTIDGRRAGRRPVAVDPARPAGAPRRTPDAARSRSRRPSRTGSSAVSRSDSPFATDEPERADVDGVRAHPLARDLERHPGARRVLVEHRDHRAPAQRGQLAHLAAQQRLAEPVGGVEQRRSRRRGVEVGRPTAGASRRMLRRSAGAGSTPSTPSISVSSTVDRARRGRWARSCRRSRRGSAARGARGRRARPAAPRAGGRGRAARRARRGRCGRRTARRRRARPARRRGRRRGSRCSPAGGGGRRRRSSR